MDYRWIADYYADICNGVLLNVAWRVLCEGSVIFFSIHDRLVQLNGDAAETGVLICEECGEEADNAASFCGQCGTPLE